MRAAAARRAPTSLRTGGRGFEETREAGRRGRAAPEADGQREASADPLLSCVRGETTVGEIVGAVKLSQSALSQHLGKLRSRRPRDIPAEFPDAPLSCG